MVLINAGRITTTASLPHYISLVTPIFGTLRSAFFGTTLSEEVEYLFTNTSLNQLEDINDSILNQDSAIASVSVSELNEMPLDLSVNRSIFAASAVNVPNIDAFEPDSLNNISAMEIGVEDFNLIVQENIQDFDIDEFVEYCNTLDF